MPCAQYLSVPQLYVLSRPARVSQMPTVHGIQPKQCIALLPPSLLLENLDGPPSSSYATVLLAPPHVALALAAY